MLTLMGGSPRHVPLLTPAQIQHFKRDGVLILPRVLDLNKYVGEGAKVPSAAAPIDQLPDLVDAMGRKCPEQLEEERASGLCAEDSPGRSAEALLRSGEWVYELYAVLVHSGGTYRPAKRPRRHAKSSWE